MSAETIRAQPLGDSAVTITVGRERSADVLRKVHSAAAALGAASIPGVLDIVPAYLTVTVFYDPLELTFAEISQTLVATCQSSLSAAAPVRASRHHEISVTYDGPDLADVAAAAGLALDDVIARHSARTYTVDIIGFVPGFAYLSELDPALHLPRRTQPRARVPAGSVGIAGSQTGVYPLDTPGGWHLIGTTAEVMFDAMRDPPALLAPGDTVQFVRLR